MISKRQMTVLIFGLFVAVGSYAQKQKVKNQPYADQRWYHFGFSVGLHSQDMIFDNSGYADENGQIWHAEIPEYSLGFSVSLIADLYLNPYLNLRFLPTMHFGDKKFFFREESTGETFSSNIRSNYLTLPLQLKFGSMRLNNYRPYLLAGVYGAFDVGRQRDMPILLKTMDYGIEIGLGCDFYLPIIKVCPEIKFCFGLADLIEHKRNDLRDKELLKFTDAISKGSSRMVVISFAFE